MPFYKEPSWVSSWLPENGLEGECPYYQQKQMAAFPTGSVPYSFQRISGPFLHDFWYPVKSQHHKPGVMVLGIFCISTLLPVIGSF